MLIGTGLALWALDNLAFSDALTTHEAGHFLTAYFLGIWVQNYPVSVWGALRLGRFSPGVLFDESDIRVCFNTKLQDIAATLIGDIAAELVAYGSAECGYEDLEQIRQWLSGIEPESRE
eukprot:jgi/Galph1/745/GphlegSOOS_G5510.1